MSKETKRIKEQMLVNSAIASIKRQLADLETSRKNYIKAAATARAEGIASQYALAKNAIKIVTAQKTVVEQMLLNLQLSTQIKDVSEMTKSFADGMKLLSGSITDTADSLNFEKVTRQMNKAMISTQLKQTEADGFLDASRAAFSGFAGMNANADDEIDRLIEAEMGGSARASGGIGGAAERDVDAELAELERRLKTGGRT